jgi:hypothetical protein
MSLPDPDTTIGNYFGLAADDTINLAAVQTVLDTLTSQHAADLVTLEGVITGLYADGIPSGAYAVTGYGPNVSVLRAPLPPVNLIDQGPAVVASLCDLVSTALVELGEPSEGPIITALNLRAAQGPELATGNNPYPGD